MYESHTIKVNEHEINTSESTKTNVVFYQNKTVLIVVMIYYLLFMK